jgi:hypothetical protein
LQPAIEQCKEKRLLALEMMIERSFADAGFRANIIHTGFVVAALRKQLDRRFENSRTGLFTALLHIFLISSSKRNETGKTKNRPVGLFLLPNNYTVKVLKTRG